MRNRERLYSAQAIVAASLAAAGHMPDGKIGIHRPEGLAAMVLAQLAVELDRTQEYALDHAERLRRDLADFEDRVLNGYYFDRPFSSHAPFDMAATVAKQRQITDTLSGVFMQMVGMPYSDAHRIVRSYMPVNEVAPYDQDYLRECAGLIALARAMYTEAQQIEAERKAAELAKDEAERARKAEKRKAARRRR